MKERIRKSKIHISHILFIGAYAVLPHAVSAQLETPDNPDSNLPGNLIEGQGNVFQTVANILLLLIGAVAVIMLIIGGFRYVVSGGDSNAVEGAKNTILYAVIGIVVAFLAYAAINFLIGELT